MSLLEQLSRGDCGIRFALPEGFAVSEDSEEHLSARSPDRAELWVMFANTPIDLNPTHSSILRQDLERAARDIFIMTSQGLPRKQPLQRLRTDDPAWSPLIEVTPISLPGGEALVVLHRTLYEPGLESIMGHILIPVRDGMIEFRSVTAAHQTGMRESVVTERKLRAHPINPGEDIAAQMRRLHSQRDFDDPALDAQFAEHPLSRARALLRELQAKITVTHPAPPPEKIVSTALRCAFLPPPRYLFQGASEAGLQLTKTSIATTDGGSRLSVVHVGRLWPVRASALNNLLQESYRSIPPPGSTEVRFTPRTGDTPGSAEGLLTFTRSDGFLVQTAIRAIFDKEQSAWLLAIETGQSSPSAELFQELDVVVQSFQRLPAPPRKPWYQFWN